MEDCLLHLRSQYLCCHTKENFDRNLSYIALSSEFDVELVFLRSSRIVLNFHVELVFLLSSCIV